MSKAVETCPNPADFIKWWRGRARKNFDEATGGLRAGNYSVTEEEANRRYKLLADGWKPGEVLAKLQKCEIPCYDMTDGEYKLGWSPKEFEKLKNPPVDKG